MNSITINENNKTEAGLDLQKLKESNFMRENGYNELLKDNAGSLTQAYGNDTISTFRVAYQNLKPNDLQIEILDLFRAALMVIEDKIDPERLRFTITKALDDEICINRAATSGGRVKLIINDDGVIALSYIPSKTSSKKSALEFHDQENADYEALAYTFFKF
jgi:hypothetical protein